MKVFTKLGLALLAIVISAGVLVAQSSVKDIGPKIPEKLNIPQTDELFDLQFEFPVGVGGGEAGIETDGDYIYTSMWNGGGEFQKYEIDGTWIETFTIAGAAGCRDIAYTGTYFYGGAASTTVFEMDFNAGTMVSTFTAPTDVRAIAYNEDDDAFYANNWGSDITKFDMSGANLGSFAVGPIGDSYYGFAYQSAALCGDGPFLWGAAQVGATQNELVQMDPDAGIETGVYFDVGSVAAVGTGIAGGLAIEEGLVSGFYTILGTAQNVNIWGLELCASGPLPDNDLGVQSILAPNTGVNLTATEAVTVAVKNYGNNAQTSFDVTFTLDGGTPVTESVSTTINSGETYEHTFATTVDLSAYGTYDIEACVILAGDENPDNDCKDKMVENLAPSLCQPLYSTGCSLGDGFTDFAMAEIENYGSGCADLNGTGWSQYFGLGPAMLMPGNTYTITMSSGYSSNFADIWIDWNDDLELTDDELILDDFELGAAGELVTVDVTIPADAPVGQHVMRARTNWNSVVSDPCEQYSYGEAEDYYVEVVGQLELCTPLYSTGCSLGDGFTDFALEEIENYGSGCADLNGTGWSQYLGLGPATLMQGGTHTVTMASGYSSNFVDIWIDWNDDYELTPDELVLDDFELGAAGELVTADIMVPADAPLGQHIMRARTNWNSVVADPCEQYSYGEAEDYFVNVVEGGSMATCEDFDALTVGGYVAGQLGGNWTTWSGAPGTAEDATVSDLYSVSPSNSMLVDGTVDMVHLITGDNITSGKWSYGFNIYVPTGTTGYFNLQKDVVPGTEWGFQAMFEDDMTIIVDGGAAAAAVIPYEYDTWYAIELIVDIDNDWCQFFIDGNLEHEYQWTLGTFGTAGANTLGGANFYANPGAMGTPPGAHFDDVCFEELPVMETARVQAIHNSADAAAEVVDVWLDDILLLDDFAFRTASPFVDAPAGVEFTLAVKGPDSTTPDDPLWSANYTLEAGETYILVADGIVSASGYNPPTAFDMAVFPMGREEASMATNTDVLVHHGSTDAPTVDVYEIGVGAGEIIDDLMYFDFAGYLELGTADYVLDVRDETGTVSVAAYEAPLATLGLDGAAITVVASGFLDPSNNSNGPGFGLWVALASGGPLVELPLYEGQECEDFDALTVGGYVADQLGGNWTTWTGAPGTAEDALVSDLYSTSPSNSMLVEGTSDVVHLITGETITEGKWSYSFNIYIPDGTTGYFNLQKDATPGVEWGFQAMFEDDMTIVVDGGAAGAAIIPYMYDTWYAIELIVDLNMDWCQFFIDGNLELEYQWTLGTFGTAGANTLGGANYFANPGAMGTPPGAHFDDVCFEMLEPGMNLPPPENLEAEVVENDVMLTWDPPAGDKGAFTNNGIAKSQNAEADPNASNEPIPSDAQFDVLFDFPVAIGGGEAGIETDGTYIYTSMWNGGGEFQKYMADGTWVETFTIAGAAGCRDIAYNGTYFYGGAASTTVFEMDFETATMMSTFSAPTDCRAIAYNEVDDAFYANNWGSDIVKFDMAGANLGSFPVGPTGDSYYGFAFDNYSDGTYLWGHAQVGATQNELVQISLPDGAETGLYFDVGSAVAVGTGIAGGLAIDGSIVDGYWTIVGTAQNVNIWGLELAEGGMSDISYNVYRDGDLIGNTMSLSYDDMDLDPGEYEYYVTAVYPDGESGPSNMVTAIVEETTTGECEDFDALTVGGYVADQLGGNWTTWSGAPGTAEDALVSDLYSTSPSNSMLVEGTSDVVHLITGETITSGKWSYSFNIYIPDGTTGYFNLQKDATPGVEWGFQAMFEDDMTIVVDGGAAGAAIIPYMYDTWYAIELIVDLNTDWCMFYIDGNLELEYQWTLGTFGTAGANTLGGANYFANPGAMGTPPGAHFDDVCFELLEPGFTPPAPTNLTGPDQVLVNEDIVLTWDEVGGGEWLQWDAGTNTGNGIGLTNGGTFSVASHWTPAELGPYDGYVLQKIQFFPNADPDATYTLKAWTGADGSNEVLSQDLTSFTIDEWNEVDLDNPVVIDASEDFWFGYEVTHAAGTFPAGCDDGPAVQGFGDMINTGGAAWESLYVLTGGQLDYNWNLAGYVALGDEKAVQPMSKPASFAPSTGDLAANGSTGVVSKFVPTGVSSKGLVGYNVYRDGEQIGFTETTSYTDNVSVPDEYDYNVTTVWEDPAGESEFSNTHTVNVITGVEEILANSINLFPNPASDVVNIRSDYTINTVTIYNHAGQIVATEDVNGNNLRVNTSTYNSGIYFFQIETDQGRIAKRIIIE